MGHGDDLNLQLRAGEECMPAATVKETEQGAQHWQCRRRLARTCLTAQKIDYCELEGVSPLSVHCHPSRQHQMMRKAEGYLEVTAMALRKLSEPKSRTSGRRPRSVLPASAAQKWVEKMARAPSSSQWRLAISTVAGGASLASSQAVKGRCEVWSQDT